jgi:hypothetical protein
LFSVTKITTILKILFFKKPLSFIVVFFRNKETRLVLLLNFLYNIAGLGWHYAMWVKHGGPTPYIVNVDGAWWTPIYIMSTLSVLSLIAAVVLPGESVGKAKRS